MVRRTFLFGCAIIAAIAASISATAHAFAAMAREVIEIAFPAEVPRDLVSETISPPRVLGAERTRSFMSRLMSRTGDGRDRSPLSVAFVT